MQENNYKQNADILKEASERFGFIFNPLKCNLFEIKETYGKERIRMSID